MKNDYQTNSVEGAKCFARMHAEPNDCDHDCDPEYPTDEDEDEEEDCNCSDPGCPCGGRKRGSL